MKSALAFLCLLSLALSGKYHARWILVAQSCFSLIHLEPIPQKHPAPVERTPQEPTPISMRTWHFELPGG